LETIYNRVFEIEYQNKFESYDLYDGSTFSFAGMEKIKNLQMVSTYLNKFSPVNLRNILSIRKRKYPHAIASIVEAYFNKHLPFIEEKEIITLSDWLIDQSLTNLYGGHCWNGLGIEIIMKNGNIKPNVPGLIGTSAVASSLIARYQKYGEPEIGSILISVRNYIVENQFVTHKDKSFFKYKPVTPEWKFTINASAIGAALVCRICKILNDERGLKEVEEAVKTIIDVQKKDGRWLYTINLKDGDHKEQIDFHQAYIIKALMEIEMSGLIGKDLKESIRRALVFQNKVQVMKTGAVYYRYPKKYPLNIHNQLYVYYTNWLAPKILEVDFGNELGNPLKWALDNLYDEKEGFIYGRYPMKKYSVPYSRWGNAHALLLISKIIK